MKDATKPIQPKDIDTSKHFFDAFGSSEREVSAGWIVRFCQDRELGWTPFTYNEIDAFYGAKGFRNFRFNGLQDYGVAPADRNPVDNPEYIISHEFVSRCYKASPAEVE